MVTGTRGMPNVMGGVETHCEELFPRLASKGLDITVIRRKNYVEDGLKEWKGVKLLDIPTSGRKELEAIVHTFRAIGAAKKLKADVLHIHAIGPALLVPYAKLLGMKVVFTHHGPDYDRDKWGKLAKTMLRLGERMACRYSDDVIVISDVIKNLIERKYGRKDRVHLIYNGVPDPERCAYPEYFSELGIEEGRYILGMCRFVPEKRLDQLVEAWRRTSGEWKLVLAGDSDFDDSYSRKLKEDARKAGVVLTGFIKGKKLHSLLSNCGVYCLPSSHEGLPISLLEAMSYGVPVIVSDIEANKEVGLSEECYFPVGDIDALTEKISKAIKQGKRQVDYDMSKYDWDKIADQVEEVYKGII